MVGNGKGGRWKERKVGDEVGEGGRLRWGQMGRNKTVGDGGGEGGRWKGRWEAEGD